MSFFKSDNTNSANSEDPLITISAETIATISGREKFESQIIAYESDPSGSDNIAMVTRANASDYSKGCKKGLVLVFNKNIKPGTYSVADTAFPFLNAYYFETGTRPGDIRSYNYHAKSGVIIVEDARVSSDELSYKISFDFKGVDKRNRGLTIKGTSSYLVLSDFE
ncbi:MULTISPECIES: hypothetical protein [Pseudomonas]|uniref:Uncharacterized protein n=1 Tax=Pseudomonas koreensis TaxID=198620 RepID=A0AA94JJV8_9PSED|nr:hypothetical protein [Pseudomonas koreensis]RVD78750.1 hypothetical protein A9HBioS_1253 [Pseudomonas koreensis]